MIRQILNKASYNLQTVAGFFIPKPKAYSGRNYQLAQDFGIKPGNKVLDIGSGPFPFPLATVLADAYTEPTIHRVGKLVRDSRPFIQCPVEHMPFQDKEIDFVFCSHVLEHVDDPIAACREIIRVGKRGYIETPAIAKETILGLSTMHKWRVHSVGHSLIFFEYGEREKEGLRNNAFPQAITTVNWSPIQKTFYENQDFFNVMFTWEDAFQVWVFRQNGRCESFTGSV